ncbi:MAG: fluoride efflux transporter CrcB [Bdellovibrionales bacterium]|nr:fluoride efflux transporter CrcB [Bdellovibrionales bacterium]
MKEYVFVGLGGMLGSMARYASVTIISQPHFRFPWGTLAVNLLGCLLIGIAAGAIEKLSTLNAELRLFIVTGFLGGFTTFSAFGLETLGLMKSGFPLQALLYVLSSVVLGVTLAYVGFRIH